MQVGLGLVIADSTGARVLDVLLPGGAYDGATRVGWKASRTAPRWKYLNKSANPPGGITSITIKDRWAQQPGLVQIRVVGKRGAYAVDPANLPLAALVILDPPTAETGQCAEVVREHVAVLVVESKNSLTHGEIVAPFSELHPRARESVVAGDDRGVEGRHVRGVQEVEEIGDGRPEALDAARI